MVCVEGKATQAIQPSTSCNREQVVHSGDMNNPTKPRIWVVTELYYPEDGATGHLLTQIAEGLTDSAEINVLTAQPSYTQKRGTSPRLEVHNDVRIRRCRSTSFSKDRLLLRLVNMATVLMSFSWNMIWHFRRGDSVLVVTNPPPLPFVVLLACRLRGAKCNLLIHDIYPDVLVPTGYVTEQSLPYRMIDFLSKALFSRVDQIVAIGRDMKQRVLRKAASLESRTHVIANWCDHEQIRPIPKHENPIRQQLGLADKFVVQYSGNVGRTHGLETIALAAKLLEDQGKIDIHWLVCGEGGGRASFESKCQELELTSVTTHDFFARKDLRHSLTVGDIGIVSFIKGMSGISVPSRMYNFFAAGLPLIGVTEADSELALTIKENDIGWVVDPGDPEALANCVLEVYEDRKDVPDMSIRCRETSTTRFLRSIAIDKYRDILLK